mmetsp:Transcript_1725/g.3015  ORF Transcript_1725/g.3015 Transcript_1725/m.3015 type:complete len:207 (-) Transcript_1725:1432-2052(-)
MLKVLSCLVDLLDVRPASAAATRHPTRHTARHSSWHAAHAALRVHGLHDRRAHRLHLLLLVLKLLLLGKLVGLEPLECAFDGVCGFALVGLRDLVLELVVVQCVLHRVAVVLEAVLRLHLLLEDLIFLGVLLRVRSHLLDVLLRQARLVVGDGDLVLLARRLLERGHVQHSIRVDVKGDVDLRHAARHRRDTREVELAQLVVVLRA